MNGSINRRELASSAIAGLAGGALGWVPVELTTHWHSLGERLSATEFWGSLVAMALVSGSIGGFILAARGHELDFSSATQTRFWRAFVICAVLAVPADLLANSVFGSILDSGGWKPGPDASLTVLMLARVVSWVIMGAMLGAGVGVSTYSFANVVKGAIGGAIGGFAGGILFDPIGTAFGSGLMSRLVGLAGIGFAIGLFIGLVQELTKAAWVTVERGRLKGRQYRVEGNQVTLGRAEENPIGLFGDSGVQQRHAVIERNGANYEIRSLAVQEGTFVNGKRIETAVLRDGDEIGVGGYALGFHVRQAAARTYASVTPSGVSAATHVDAGQPAYDGATLIDAVGGHHQLRAGTETRLGRAVDNDIVINDSSVSRHHASIAAVNGTFELRDLGSQNGTFIGDRRVTQASLADGDSIRLGQAPFVFRA